jgi:hypothetical protein
VGKKRDNYEDPDVGWTIIKWILKKKGAVVWTGFI